MRHYQTPDMQINLLDDEDIISTSDTLPVYEGNCDNASSGEDVVIF